MVQLYHEFNSVADFLTIYIMEAHASDEWPQGKRIKINQHKNLLDRFEAVHKFQKENNFIIRMAIDNIDNSFCEKYSSWPEQYFIIHQNTTLLFKGEANQFGYKDHVYNNLNNFLKSVSSSFSN